MKILLVICLVTVVCGNGYTLRSEQDIYNSVPELSDALKVNVTKTRNDLHKVEDIIDDIIKKIKEFIQSNIPEPIKIDKHDFVIPPNTILSGSLNITDLEASGLKNFDLSKELLTVKFGLKKFTLNTNYAMDLPLFKIPLLSFFGDGSIRFDITTLNASITLDLIGVFNKEFVKEFKYSLENLEFDVTGILDDDEISKIISDTINTNTIMILKNYNKEISELIKNILNATIQRIIHKKAALYFEEMAYGLMSTENYLILLNALNEVYT